MKFLVTTKDGLVLESFMAPDWIEARQMFREHMYNREYHRLKEVANDKGGD